MSLTAGDVARRVAAARRETERRRRGGVWRWLVLIAGLLALAVLL